MLKDKKWTKNEKQLRKATLTVLQSLLRIYCRRQTKSLKHCPRYGCSVLQFKSMPKTRINATQRHLKTTGPAIRPELCEILHGVFLICKSSHFNRCQKPVIVFNPMRLRQCSTIFETPLLASRAFMWNDSSVIPAGIGNAWQKNSCSKERARSKALAKDSIRSWTSASWEDILIAQSVFRVCKRFET